MKPSSGSGAFATRPSSKSASELLAVTAGEPAGIGPELCLALADTPWNDRVVVIGDLGLLEERARLVGAAVLPVPYREDAAAEAGRLRVIDRKLPVRAACGAPDPANAAALLEALEFAVSGCRRGDFAALVTAPLHKGVINDAGIPFTGHTEYIAGLTDSPQPVMLLVADRLRVALATTHLPLRAVPDSLSTDGITAVIEVLRRDLVSRFRIRKPAIVVCGLNPHAGEGGHLGSEDAEIIAPAVARCAAAGIDVRGPVPADTAFTPAAGPADAILAMFHDQGLPVVKHAGFGHAVNVTLGLPIVRTSVDHGTAFDLAGKGTADPGSLIAAVKLAAELAAPVAAG